MKPYPLKFRPKLKERVWGGNALTQFGLELPDSPIGEAWTIADHPNGTTVVVNGELTGIGLDVIRERYGSVWFGKKYTVGKYERFPLLFKLLDCNEDLSVQVHPDDDYVGLPKGELGKSEMWYVLDAEPDAKIIYGLKPGMNKDKLGKALWEDRAMDCLQQVSVEPGDTFFIPAGTEHSLCSGVLVAEIQRNSDTTYRLYDYNRPGLDGKPRELHITDSLNVINYDNEGIKRGKTVITRTNHWYEIAKCPYFITDKAVVSRQWTVSTTADTFTVLIVAGGKGAIRWADGSIEINSGDSLLLPANLGGYTIEGNMNMLRCRLP